jgi:hypothetical protein
LTKEVKAFVSKFKEFSGTELDMDLKHAQVCDQFRAELVKLQSQRCQKCGAREINVSTDPDHDLSKG